MSNQQRQQKRDLENFGTLVQHQSDIQLALQAIDRDQKVIRRAAKSIKTELAAFESLCSSTSEFQSLINVAENLESILKIVGTFN